MSIALSSIRAAAAPTLLPWRAPTQGARTVRVVRVLDSNMPGCAGRLVISGRMADVCAELERMVRREQR
jgi:hypothetical protein